VNALVLRASDKTAKAYQRKFGYELSVSDGWELPAERTLFVATGTAVPYNLLDAGYHWLERWDVAAPLWRYGVLAADIGTPSERKATEKVILDLRQLLYAHELLFVRDSEAGRGFLQRWRLECVGKGIESRLAFLRALHIVKPLFCALPCSWLAAEAQRARQDARAHIAGPIPPKEFRIQGGALSQVTKPHRTPAGLVHVELAPGRYMLCRPGDEDVVRERFGNLGKRRHA